MSTGGTTPPVVRHLLLCQYIVWDKDNPAAPYTLQGVVTALSWEPPGDGLLESLWVFAKASGDPGEYEVWLDLVPLDDAGEDAGEGTTFGPLVWSIPEGVYAHSRAWVLRNIPFPTPGVYEFRLRCGPDVLAREQILLLEV
jgi:hypothetical protein